MSLLSLFRSKVLPEHLNVGRRGEDTAVKYLKSIGYSIRDRNVRLKRDEIDVLAFDPEDHVLVFAEVKTLARRYENFSPEMHADFRKRKKLRRSAVRWVNQNKYEGGYRIDLISVTEGKVLQHFVGISCE